MTALPTPINLERVRSLLVDKHLHFTGEDSGAWSVPTKNASYTWSLENPQVLQVRGQWRGIASTPETFLTMRKVVSRCNSTRISPKAYLLPFDNNQKYALMAECNVLIEGGLNETQFYGFCETALLAIMGFFGEAELALPELVTWSNEE